MKRLVFTSIFIPLFAIPLTIIIFIILPRTEFPILGFLERPEKARTGFTDTVRLGAVSDIYEDEGVVFRVAMDRINEKNLYFRGAVMEYFDGREWRSRKKTPLRKSCHLDGRHVEQIIFLEPQEKQYLFLLDRPLSIDVKDIKRFSDLTFNSLKPLHKRTRYKAISVISDPIPLLDEDLTPYLQIPPSISKRVLTLTERLTKGKSEEKKIESIKNFLKTNYKHSLHGLSTSKDPLDTFLFEKKYGNCEFFASACALMLRISNIPTRVVGGFRGGYYNEIGRYYIITGRHAHLWVEAFLKGKGWIRIDPTPEINLTETSPFLRLRMLFDTINYYFYISVINYNLEKQIRMFENLKGLKIKKPKFNKKWIVGILGIQVLFFIYFLLYKLRTLHRRDVLSLFLKAMKSKGYIKRPSQGLEEFIEGIKDPDLKRHAEAFVFRFEGIYFRDGSFNKEDLKIMKDAIKRIKRHKSNEFKRRYPFLLLKS